MVAGKDLCIRDKSMFYGKGSSDPYCKISLGGNLEVGSTEVVKKNLNPEWNAIFSLEVPIKCGPFITLAIFDSDVLSTDDAMGCVQIHLNDLPATGEVFDRWLPVEKCSGADDASGFIHVIASFEHKIPVALNPGEPPIPLRNSKFDIGCGWDLFSTTKQRDGGQKIIDLDVAAVCFGRSGAVLEAIYFGNLTSTSKIGAGAIIHSGDSRDGEDGIMFGDDEVLHFNTAMLSDNVLAVFICVSAFSDGTFFSDVKQSHARVRDPATGSELMRLTLGNLGSKTAITLVRVERFAASPSGWAMSACCAGDSTARNWGFLVPQMKALLGADLVPGLQVRTLLLDHIHFSPDMPP